MSEYIPRSYRQCLAKLRCGSLPLAVETGRYAKPAIQLNERICKLCNSQSIENEIHFLIECDLYDDLRRELFDNMVLVDNCFMEYNPLVKMCMLMSCNDLQKCLAKTCFMLFRKRKQNML